MDIFGTTRSRIARNYALLTPDTHVPLPLIGWENATAYFHITPEMGARFQQYTAVLSPGGKSTPPAATVERLIFVLEGNLTLDQSGKTSSLKPGSFAFFPAGAAHSITTKEASKLIVFEKKYLPLDGVKPPPLVIGHEDDIEAKAFLGDPDARLKTLLPIEPAFDLAVNIFTYQPGATLPFVEIHVMEHGLQMLQGSGVYRLGDDYMPVAAGDIIWMASYCPQWFVAMGKQPARYIYYKDIHRDGLELRG